ncbi:MAG TPA: hypothetical protein P5193_03120 [Microthrixaceae bacterium]|nr:hypothetical protein [Microthrixaceae bacterium]
MTRLGCDVYDWVPGALLASVPWTAPDAEPVRVPALPGERGEERLVAVADFPSGRFRGVLWDASFSQHDRARHLGGNQLVVSAPASRRNMRIVGVAEPGEVDQFGGQLYNVSNAVSLELAVGSTVDGAVRRRYVVRDEVRVEKGRISISAVGWVGGLTSDRVIGAPTRRNLIVTNPSFEQGTLAGWRLHGDVEAEVVAGGVDGNWCARARGTPGAAWIERRVVYSQPERPWGRQRIAGAARVKLPTGVDIEDYGLVTVAVVNGGVVAWPDPRRGDPEAAVVTGDMARGDWLDSPVVAFGYLPTPPYTADVWVRLHATDDVAWTYFDDGAIYRRENSSTVTSKDLVAHPTKLFDHAQNGREKYTEGRPRWGIGVVEGEPCGISRVGTWWHEDGERLDDALGELCDEGIDVWDLAGPGRRVASSKRQGRVRTDLRINEADVLGSFAWRLDPGAIRNAIRATSAAGSVWGGADEGLVDHDAAAGQVIDVVLSAPVGMSPAQLKVWLAAQMRSLTTEQAGMGLLVRWPMGQRVEVGDTVPVAARHRSAVLKDWLRITEWSPDQHCRFVAVTLGTDPERGNR